MTRTNTRLDSKVDHIRRLVLRTHGTVLFVLTTVNLVVITIGYFTGRGYYGPLTDQPMGFAGLWQAYGIMFTVGFALWLGSYTTRPRWFDAIGAAAHIPVLFALLAFPAAHAIFLDGRIALVSAPIHITAILVEGTMFFWPDRRRATVPTPA